MGFPSSEQAALAGDRAGRTTYVLASAVGTDAAVVILMDPAWAQPDRVDCERTDDGWVETTSGSGQTCWWSTSDESDVGVLASWGKAEEGATGVVVSFMGTTTRLPVTNGHWAWIVEGVPEGAVDEPADFRWLK